ncbi:hypothetical protein Scep_010803 [Stephania cephalantha]|uniref:Uncharacterized protein n=1 Tax=Stephania cephalantha TaxID=152367 RepID=A0AAP0JY76_9MAGN
MSDLVKKMKRVLSLKNPPIKFEYASSSDSPSTLSVVKPSSTLDLRNIHEVSIIEIEQSL